MRHAIMPSLFLDAKGDSVFPVYENGVLTEEKNSLLVYTMPMCGQKSYRYGFDPDKETLQDALRNFIEYLEKETNHDTDKSRNSST